MANVWTFRNPAKPAGEQLESHDLGSAGLIEFIRANPHLGPVRRGAVEDPTYIAPTAYGGNVEAPVVEQSDPTSAEPATRYIPPPPPPPSSPPPPTSDPLEGRMLREDIGPYLAHLDSVGLPRPAGYENWVIGEGGPGPSAWSDPSGAKADTMSGFANPDSFSPENRYGFGKGTDPDTGFSVDIDRSGLFADDSEVAGGLRELQEVLPKNLSSEQQASLTEFIAALSGPLFDEDGNPIFPEMPMEVFSELLNNKDIAPIIGPILQDLIGNRSTVIQNRMSNEAGILAARAQYNPLGRTAESDRSLQEMLAQREIERTQAQFNPFGLSQDQGVSAIQTQFNPYMQDADARLALAKQQFDPYGQDADARTALISAQFNPYDYNQTQGLQALTRQYNPYGFSQAQGLEGISRQFNPYGETAADRLALAGMAQNPFGRNQFEDQMLQEALARGGLSADQRLAEIRASNNPMNTQNFLSFLGNPSAVGSAVSLGGQGFLNQLGGGQGLPQQAQQSPQTLNPLAPLVQQLMDDRLASDPAPAVDTGSADFSYGAMKPYDPTAPASTQADFQDKTAEEIGFFEGSAAAQGVTPSALGRRTARVTPGGVTAGRGRI